MNVSSRNLLKPVKEDLEKKFVFLSGPRQVGKTTFAKQIIKKNRGMYLSYDAMEDRQVILKRAFVGKKMVCLDEFHKYHRWKSFIKGLHDKHHENLKLLLTGSARLNVFQKSGDSLFGRYYLHQLFPFTLGELECSNLKSFEDDWFEPADAVSELDTLLRFGGFPEPLFAQSAREHRRWSTQRLQLLVREELREISQIQMLSVAEQLMMLLPERIGSLFSYRSLSEDVRVSVPTISNWMDNFEKLFLFFRILPYAKKVQRSLQRQPKYYFYDWSQITDEGARFENLIASHLYKAVETWNALGETNLGLHYIRDRAQREVDFLVTKDKKPFYLIEAKLSETRFSPHLEYFSKLFSVPAIQLVKKKGVYKKQGALTLMSANRFLPKLP